MSRTLRAIAPALVLLVALSAGTAHALPLPGRTTTSQPAGLFEAAWGWLTGLFVLDPGQGSAAESRDKAGWEMDPNGAPAPIVSAYHLTSSDEDAPALVADPDGD
jgi:hypothetical protein